MKKYARIILATHKDKSVLIPSQQKCRGSPPNAVVGWLNRALQLQCKSSQPTSSNVISKRPYKAQ